MSKIANKPSPAKKLQAKPVARKARPAAGRIGKRPLVDESLLDEAFDTDESALVTSPHRYDDDLP